MVLTFEIEGVEYKKTHTMKKLKNAFDITRRHSALQYVFWFQIVLVALATPIVLNGYTITDSMRWTYYSMTICVLGMIVMLCFSLPYYMQEGQQRKMSAPVHILNFFIFVFLSWITIPMIIWYWCTPSKRSVALN